MNERYVLDASVAAKWFLHEEEHVEIAEIFLRRMLEDQISLHAPSLIRFELGHVLTKAQRRKRRRIEPDMSLRAYRSFIRMPVTFHDLDDEALINSLEFSVKLHRGFYDSVYVCLAIELECKWLTSERRYGSRLPKDFPTDHVLVLESLA